jgi:acyl-CoA thioesterase-1
VGALPIGSGVMGSLPFLFVSEASAQVGNGQVGNGLGPAPPPQAVQQPVLPPTLAQSGAGQTPADDPNAPAPPALSRECQTPGVRISGEIDLPRVTNALKQRRKIKILTIGASSKGGKAGNDSSYQAIIEALLEKTIPGVDVQMIDRGFSGELARDAAERIKTEVALVKPDLVLWQLGTHDALMHMPVDDFKATVSSALDWLRDHDVDVVMVGLHYLRHLVPDKHYQGIRVALRQIAEEKKVLWIGRYEAMQVIEQARRAGSGPSPNEFTLTDNGYACLSEYVVRALTTGAFARPLKQPTTPPPTRG